MQAHAQHHGLGKKTAADQAADSTGAHDRPSTQQPSLLHGGGCASFSACASREASESHHDVENTSATNVPDSVQEPGSSVDLAVDDGGNAACEHTRPGAEDWHAEAQASAQSLSQKCVLSKHGTNAWCCSIIVRAHNFRSLLPSSSRPDESSAHWMQV